MKALVVACLVAALVAFSLARLHARAGFGWTIVVPISWLLASLWLARAFSYAHEWMPTLVVIANFAGIMVERLLRGSTAKDEAK
ncbi:hypothetical protein [Pseudomarimonas arenosa]|uniref:Uncharacterized protein n=1 Tax=Pseudomarimonas arenosa TaxID=2774145 RepID=A0AAW3ZQD5_9GAMM|nr:hypothetical protein [Pseudomarimonas arenosa]MBD8528162.1 hypothetical protein [Pseudomarimonas arenosa]MBD8528163.1 hypothetical protein [Pseudomarimonas arenosa]